MNEAVDKKVYSPWAIAMVVSLAAFMEVLDTTITNVSLSHIAGTLGASQDESTWVLTSYLVANGIVLPLSGWLASVFGRKRFFMMCIGAFTFASLACGLSQSLGMLICFRLLQGFFGGGLQPMQQSIIIDAFPPEKRGAAFGVTGVTMIVAPILGPTLGGYITDNFSWQWIFFMNVPVGIIAVFLVNKMLEDPPQAKAKGFVSIDYIGLGLVAVGLGTLQVFLDRGQQDDWFDSNFICTFGAIAAVCLTSAVLWMLNREDPVVDVRLLKEPSFAMPCIMMFFMGMSLYGGSTLLPLLTQSEFGYDATTAGLVLSPGGFAVIFLMPVAGRLVGVFPSRYLIALGMAICGVGMFWTSRMTPQVDYNTFVTMRILQVLGLPFLFIPLGTLAFSKTPKEKSSKASAIFTLSRNLGGSVGIALIVAYVTRRGQFHQNALVQNLQPANQGFKATLSGYAHTIMDHGGTMLTATREASGVMYAQLLHQANLIAFADAFFSVGVLMATLSVVALFMPYNNPRKKAGDAAAAAH